MSETSPSGNVRKWKYNKHGNTTSETYPNGDVYKYKYNKHGNTTSKTCPDGKVWRWTYKYDKQYRLIKIQVNKKTIMEIKITED